MPVPTSMQDLSAAAASNSPQGSENVAPNLDNYLRSHAAIIRQTYSMASSSIASASTVDVAAADGESVDITGTATINSLGAGFSGCLRELRFSGAATLSASASIQGLPGSSNITVAAGETMTFRCIASGQWRMVAFSRLGASFGFTPVNKAGDTMTGALEFSGTALRIRGDFNSAPQSNRTLFQSAASGANTTVGAIPNGSGNVAIYSVSNSSDADNAGAIQLRANPGEMCINSVNTGVGVLRDIHFQFNGLPKATLNNAGTFTAHTFAASSNATISGNQVWHAGNSARVIVSATDPGGADGTVWVQP